MEYWGNSEMPNARRLRITANTETGLTINQMEKDSGAEKAGTKKQNEPVRHLTTATAHAHNIPCHHTRHFVRSCRPTAALHFLFARRTRWRRSRGKTSRHRLSEWSLPLPTQPPIRMQHASLPIGVWFCFFFFSFEPGTRPPWRSASLLVSR